jgi:hypothetical protein
MALPGMKPIPWMSMMYMNFQYNMFPNIHTTFHMFACNKYIQLLKQIIFYAPSWHVVLYTKISSSQINKSYLFLPKTLATVSFSESGVSFG